jgi:DNA-binding response OmpR family regulator
MLPMPRPPATPLPDRPILVVDDDAKIVRLVRTYLERDGFSVVTAADGPAALDAIERHRPALVVLDLMLPELDGRAVVRAVRRDDEAGATPILIVSARGSTLDRIAGLEDGADDYLPKPFSPAELVLRVKSILRRTAAGAGDPESQPSGSTASAPDASPAIRHADLVVDPDRHEVTRDGRPIPLTRVEFRLLQTILEADGRVLSRDQLLDAIYGHDQADVLDRTVDVHVGRLRDKLGDDADQPRYVATVRGVGYRAAPAGGGEPRPAAEPAGPEPA